MNTYTKSYLHTTGSGLNNAAESRVFVDVLTCPLKYCTVLVVSKSAK